MVIKRKRGAFVCFTGMDGTGKTSHAEALVERLRGEGIRCKYARGQCEPFFILGPIVPLGKMLVYRARKSRSYSEGQKAKKSFFKNHALGIIWQYIILFNHLLLSLLRFGVRFRQDEVIVCDRYFYDALVELSIDTGLSGKKNLLLRLFPKPDLVFLIDAPEDIAYKRKNDIPTLGYLRNRRKRYLSLAMEHKTVVVDGAGDFSQEQRQIVDKVLAYLQEGEEGRRNG